MAKQSAKKLLVRLKPHNPRKGCVLRTFVHGPTGKRFEERRGWYTIDALASFQRENERGEMKKVLLVSALREARQVEGDEDSKGAFDICTLEEARAIDAREKKEGVRRAGAGEANDLTTRDLGNGRRAAEDAGEAPETRRRVPAGPRGARSPVERPSRGARSMQATADAE